MRFRKQRNQARASGVGLARDIDIPLPTSGVFVESKSSEVSGMYAGELTNWRSTGASLRLRSQYALDPEGLMAVQRVLFEYGASQEYVRVTDTQIVAGLTIKDRANPATFDFAYISSNVIMVDGAGDPVLYNGTAFSDGGFTTSTGVTQDEFDGIVAHQDRPFLWTTGDDLDFYYGDVGAITGSLSRFPLGRLGNITGTILCAESVTVDAGENLNDMLAIFTTTGDIVAYEGTDPGDSSAWGLRARLKVATPISKDAFVRVGGDVWMLTGAGVVSVLQTLRDSAMALVNTVSRPVQEQLIEQVSEGGTWSMHRSANAKLIIINRVYDGAASQFIYHTETKSWAYADYPARQWHNLGLRTQFTTLDGDLAELNEDGTFDITATWISSWFRLPRATGITYLHPTIKANGALAVSLTVLSDHDETSRDIAEAVQTVTIEPDHPADDGGRVALNERMAVDATGSVFQIRMEITAKWAELVNMKAGVL